MPWWGSCDRLREAVCGASCPPTHQTCLWSPTLPGPGPDRLAQALAATQMGAGCGPVMAEFFAKFTAEQKARRKKYNDISNQRKRDRELLALKTQADLSRRVVGRGGADPQPGVDGAAGLRAVGAR